MKNVIVLFLRLFAIAAICILLFVLWIFLTNQPSPGGAEFLFIGTQNDADAACFFSDDRCVIIDTGEAVDAAHFIQVLEDREIEKIDCLILTHPDKDHVGGAAALMEAFPVTEILTPYYVGDKEAYNEAMEQAKEMGVPVTVVSQKLQLAFGTIKLSIFPPEESFYEESNDYSLGILAEHGEVRLFLAGDAEKKRIKELLELDLPTTVDLYKVARHGRNSNAGVELIQSLSPKNAIITANQAESKIASALEEVNAVSYSTYKQDVFFFSDQTELKLEAIKPI